MIVCYDALPATPELSSLTNFLPDKRYARCREANEKDKFKVEFAKEANFDSARGPPVISPMMGCFTMHCLQSLLIVTNVFFSVIRYFYTFIIFDVITHGGI